MRYERGDIFVNEKGQQFICLGGDDFRALDSGWVSGTRFVGSTVPEEAKIELDLAALKGVEYDMHPSDIVREEIERIKKRGVSIIRATHGSV